MLTYSADDLFSDASIMTSTCPTENFGLPWPGSSSSLTVGSSSHNEDHLLSIIHQHSDCIRFLTFAEKSMRAESTRSNNYSMSMKTKQIRHSDDTGGSEIAVGERGSLNMVDAYHNRIMEDIVPLLPLSLKVSEINSATTHSSMHLAASCGKISQKQLRRDVERDTFKVNGNFLIGSEEGLEGICSVIIQCCNEVLSQCCLQLLDKDVEVTFAHEVLAKASRTHSGGIAYQCIQYMIKPDNIVIVPVSTLAKPLKINISVGSFIDSDTVCYGPDNRWGLVCAVECSTFFSLKSIDGLSPLDFPIENIEVEKLDDVTVQVLYEDSVCLPINPTTKCSIRNLNGIRGISPNSGKVTVHKLMS